MTKDLDRAYELELETVRQWLAAGEIEDYKTREDIGAIWIKLPSNDWELYWDWTQYLEPRHPTEADII